MLRQALDKVSLVHTVARRFLIGICIGSYVRFSWRKRTDLLVTVTVTVTVYLFSVLCVRSMRSMRDRIIGLFVCARHWHNATGIASVLQSCKQPKLLVA